MAAWFGFLLLVIGVILPACRNDDKPVQAEWQNAENALHFDIRQPFGTLYPPDADACGATWIFPLPYSYLCLPSPTGEMTPDLAHRWEYDPSRFIWMFHLRDDARYHNGVPVTAQDVGYSFKTIVKTLRPILGKLVKEIRIPSDKTIVFELNQDDPFFCDKIWNFEIIPDPVRNPAIDFFNRYDVNAPFASLNPTEVICSGSTHIFPLLYSFLFVPNDKGELEPDLSISWAYDSEKLQWTIHLRDNAVFHNRQHVTVQGCEVFH